jgi:acyl carrier protein
MIDSVTDQILAIASDVLNVPVARLSRNTAPEDVKSWDSVQHIILMMAVEQHFSVSFAPEDIDQATSLGQIAASVERRLDRRSSFPQAD